MTQTRLEVCVYVCALQRAAKCAKVEHALRLNKVAKWCKRKSAKLVYRVLQNPCRIQVISDSAFRKEDVAGLAIRGAIIAIIEWAADHPGGALHFLEWYSRKQRRVTRSTFSAELNALSDAVDFGKLLALTLTEVLRPIPQAATLVAMEQAGNFAISLEAVVDAKSVYDALTAVEIKPPTETSLVMMLCGIKEMLLCHSLDKLWWCDTHDMLSDGLNKGAVSRQALLDAGNTGRWDLKNMAVGHREYRYVPILSSSSLRHPEAPE